MDIVIFGGRSSFDRGILIENPPNYETPARDYDSYHIPGRNGNIIIDRGSYQNVPRTYNIAIGDRKKDFTNMANLISEWLHVVNGYARLEDSFEPEYYRLAKYDEATTITNIYEHAGRATIKFDCKPQRFLKSGDKATIFTASGVLRNPTAFESLPIINVFGSGAGVLKVDGRTVSISSINTSVTINSEIQDAYSGTVNRNSTVTLTNGFPRLAPGENEISFSGGITKVEVKPKWWTL